MLIIISTSNKQTKIIWKKDYIKKTKKLQRQLNILTLGNGRPSVVFTEFQHSLLNSGPKIYMQLD